jgi:hypothetical protein
MIFVRDGDPEAAGRSPRLVAAGGDPRSWAYWHVVFGLEPPGEPPRRALPGS